MNSVARPSHAVKPALQSTRLLEQLRERLRYMHYSIRTEDVYLYWVKAFIRFHELRHPREMGRDEVVAFLTHLATQRQVAPSTHKQALSALLFLYRQVLEIDLPWMTELARPAATRRIPAVLTQQEVVAVLARLDGEAGLLARLLYGTGMRLMEGLRLRVKDVEFSRGVIIVRDGKGGKDRVVMLPQSLVEPLRAQLHHARALWALDRAAGRHGVHLPFALERKYPMAGQSWSWHWVFPAGALSLDPRAMIYTHGVKMAAGHTASPLDVLAGATSGQPLEIAGTGGVAALLAAGLSEPGARQPGPHEALAQGLGMHEPGTGARESFGVQAPAPLPGHAEAAPGPGSVGASVAQKPREISASQRPRFSAWWSALRRSWSHRP